MSFEDIKGQDRAIGILTEAIRRMRIFSAYMFVGPDGIGKLAAAKNFAKAVNCKSRKTHPCEECVSCKKINSGAHPDVILAEPRLASSSVGIERVRELIARANLKPYEGIRKVFIIDKAHAMTQEAQNSFLKTLEEPPNDTTFILVSRSEAALLPTIASRCHVIKFSVAPRSLVKDVLKSKFNIKAAEADILSNFSSGRIGEAVRLSEENLIPRKNALLRSLLSGGGDFYKVLSAHTSRRELKENIEFIISFLRDAFLYKARGTEEGIFNIDKKEDIKTLSEQFECERLDSLIKRLIGLGSYVDYNVNPKIVIDVLTNELRRYHARSNTGEAARSR
ncbi:DNA polymerase III subunit delta' [Candidatus Omnitrophota bacterium]